MIELPAAAAVPPATPHLEVTEDQVRAERRVGRVLALDISTSAGWALLAPKAGRVDLLFYGQVVNAGGLETFGPYPWSYLAAADSIAVQLVQLYLRFVPDVVVVEETNGSKSRYTQKILEFLHAIFLERLRSVAPAARVEYVSSSDWRRTLGQRLSKEQARQNRRLAVAKRKARDAGTKLDKKALGIRGAVGKKHLALAWTNATFGLALKVKDDDIADAISQGCAWVLGAPISLGK